MLAIEGFFVAVLPRATGFCVKGPYTIMFEPSTNHPNGELESDVGADMIHWASVCKQIGEKLEDITRTDPPGDRNCKAIPRELIDHCGHPEGLAVMDTRLNEMNRFRHGSANSAGDGSWSRRWATAAFDSAVSWEPSPLARLDTFDPIVMD